jgi:hypothetical protein
MFEDLSPRTSSSGPPRYQEASVELTATSDPAPGSSAITRVPWAGRGISVRDGAKSGRSLSGVFVQVTAVTPMSPNRRRRRSSEALRIGFVQGIWGRVGGAWGDLARPVDPNVTTQSGGRDTRRCAPAVRRPFVAAPAVARAIEIRVENKLEHSLKSCRPMTGSPDSTHTPPLSMALVPAFARPLARRRSAIRLVLKPARSRTPHRTPGWEAGCGTV